MSVELIDDGVVNSNKQETENMFATFFFSIYLIENFNFESKLLDIPEFALPNNVYFSIDNVLKGLSVLKSNWSIVHDDYLVIIYIKYNRSSYSLDGH